MICQQCRTQLSRLHWQQRIISTSSKCSSLPSSTMRQSRLYSDSPAVPSMPPPPAPRQPAPASKPGKPVTIPSAISSATPGVSQPLTTPEGVHVSVDPAKPTKPPVETKVLSSCAAGTKLNGLNYVKNKPDVFALEDSAYPDWLWTLLDDSKKKSKTELGGVDPSTLNKKQRKRHEKKMAALAASLPRKIPLHEQATDITPAPYNMNGEAPSGLMAQAADSLEKRSAIRKSAREARRKGIREANFLRGL